MKINTQKGIRMVYEANEHGMKLFAKYLKYYTIYTYAYNSADAKLHFKTSTNVLNQKP